MLSLTAMSITTATSVHPPPAWGGSINTRRSYYSMNYIIKYAIILAILMGLGASTLSAPTAPVGPTAGSPGTSYSYTTKATDSNGYQLKYTFDWGDGSKSTTCLVNQGITIRLVHKWAAAGTYNLKIRVTNSKGVVSAWSAPLQVVIGSVAPPANTPPKTPYVPDGEMSGRTTSPLTYTTMAFDPDGDKAKITFDWGDGTTSTTGLVASGAWVSESHQWSGVEPGTFKAFAVRAMATDEHGAKSAWSAPITVLIGAPYVNHAPGIVTIDGPTEGISGEPMEFTFAAEDPDGDDLKYIISWSTGGTTTEYAPSGQPVTVPHTYTLPVTRTEKVYKVSAIAVDAFDIQGVWSDPLYVTVSSPLVLSCANINDSEPTSLNTSQENTTYA